ncbi:MAG: ribosome maturation factor RimP [Pseudomonadota bacterium]
MADKASLEALVKPAVEAAGMQLWGLEYQVLNRRALLRIYIDSPNGVTVDDCALVSHQVSGVLDVADPISSDYRLEVSSPGWDRPLFTAAHFIQFVGQTVKVKTVLPVAGRRNFTGQLVAADQEQITLQIEPEKTVRILVEQIDKAHIVPDVEAELQKAKNDSKQESQQDS